MSVHSQEKQHSSSSARPHRYVTPRMPAGYTIVHPKDPRISFKFPPKAFPLDLNETTASSITAVNLAKQLNGIGLNCDTTKPQNLQPIIDQTRAMLPLNGQGQIWTITKQASAYTGQFVAEADGQWEPSATAAGYRSDLAVVSKHFDDLKSGYGSSFSGYKNTQPTRQGRYDSIEAIKNLFISVAIDASAAVVTGIDKIALEAVLSNAIAPLDDASAKNYNKYDDRFICLVLGYDPITKDVQGIGFVSISWHLVINDYKKKSKDSLQHDTTLDISSWSCVYDDPKELEAEVKWVQSRYPNSFYAVKGFPPKYQFKIFNTLPSAGEEAFNSGLPLDSNVSKQSAMVFYAADLASLGSLTNKGSAASSSYSISTTSGFSFEMSQKISAGVKMEAGVVFAKAEVSISLELSFTEQWNTSQTETISFQVPADQQSFIYKGTLQTRILYFDPQNSSYSWGSSGVFYTNYIVSSGTPLNGDPVYKS